jgi:hypothetical protein
MDSAAQVSEPLQNRCDGAQNYNNTAKKLLRNYSGGCHGGEVEAKFAGLALKVAEHAFFKKAFIGFLAGFDVGFAEFEHSIE